MAGYDLDGLGDDVTTLPRVCHVCRQASCPGGRVLTPPRIARPLYVIADWRPIPGYVSHEWITPGRSLGYVLVSVN